MILSVVRKNQMARRYQELISQLESVHELVPLQLRILKDQAAQAIRHLVEEIRLRDEIEDYTEE